MVHVCIDINMEEIKLIIRYLLFVSVFNFPIFPEADLLKDWISRKKSSNLDLDSQH